MTVCHAFRSKVVRLLPPGLKHCCQRQQHNSAAQAYSLQPSENLTINGAKRCHAVCRTLRQLRVTVKCCVNQPCPMLPPRMTSTSRHMMQNSRSCLETAVVVVVGVIVVEVVVIVIVAVSSLRFARTTEMVQINHHLFLTTPPLLIKFGPGGFP